MHNNAVPGKRSDQIKANLGLLLLSFSLIHMFQSIWNLKLKSYTYILEKLQIQVIKTKIKVVSLSNLEVRWLKDMFLTSMNRSINFQLIRFLLNILKYSF